MKPTIILPSRHHPSTGDTCVALFFPALPIPALFPALPPPP